MKTLIFRLLSATFMLLLISTVTAVNAQTINAETLRNSTPEQRADLQNKLMKEKLNLSDTQYLQVSQLNLEYARKMQPLLTSTSGRMGKAFKAKSLYKEKESKLKAVLTDEQFKIYQEEVKERIDAAKNAFMKKNS